MLLSFVADNHNALAVASLWAPVVAIYLLDIYLFYTILSAVWGFLLGARDRLGEIRSLEALHKLFEQFPGAFMNTLHVPLPNRTRHSSSSQDVEKNKFDAARFAPFWNEIIKNLREEDYIANFEMELLSMPKNSGNLPMVQLPLFLLASKVFLAKDIAVESRDSQEELWERISRDEYMKYAVQECHHTIKHILTEILDGEGRTWVKQIYADIDKSIENRSIHVDFQLSKLPIVISRVTALMGILKEVETPLLEKGAVEAVQDLYDVVRHDVLSINKRDNIETWKQLSEAWTAGRLFANLKWPKDAELRALVKRLYSLLTIKDSAANIPKNLEARRRLEFFANSLFMAMPKTRPVREMLSFSVFTPYYSETVLYSVAELQKKNEDGISILFYLQKIYPGEGGTVLEVFSFSSGGLGWNPHFWRSFQDWELEAVDSFFDLLYSYLLQGNGLVVICVYSLVLLGHIEDIDPVVCCGPFGRTGILRPWKVSLQLMLIESCVFFKEGTQLGMENFLARIGRDENTLDQEILKSTNVNDTLELRFWASYRGQTLARTVRGMMYYRKALMLQTYLERITSEDLEAAVSVNDATETQGFELSPAARAQADLKFTYVVTCQIYGRQKEEQKPEAADIALLMQRNEALRVAFIDDVENLKDGKAHTEFYSKLVKADINGKDKEIYSIKLPGNPKLGEGKPENQNHAIIFTRGNAVQTIDMNQDNYFEEALKVRNLLEEFHSDHGIRPPTILGVREHVFTGSVSSLAFIHVESGG
uniref:1,3-beta-glucan synthase n=1 Tax=Fagus sylvatica TaxID=28930 RepID=A0A2N9INZ6_FAGSY